MRLQRIVLFVLEKVAEQHHQQWKELRQLVLTLKCQSDQILAVLSILLVSFVEASCTDAGLKNLLDRMKDQQKGKSLRLRCHFRNLSLSQLLVTNGANWKNTHMGLDYWNHVGTERDISAANILPS